MQVHLVPTDSTPKDEKSDSSTLRGKENDMHRPYGTLLSEPFTFPSR